MVVVALNIADILLPTPPPETIIVNVGPDWTETVRLKRNPALRGHAYSLMCPMCGGGARKLYANAVTHQVGCRMCLKLTWVGRGRRTKDNAERVYASESDRNLHAFQRGVYAQVRIP